MSYHKLHNVVTTMLRTIDLTISVDKIKSITNYIYLTIINSKDMQNCSICDIFKNIFDREFKSVDIKSLVSTLNINETDLETIRYEIISQTQQSITATHNTVDEQGYLWLLQKYLAYESKQRGGFYIECYSNDLSYGEIMMLKSLV